VGAAVLVGVSSVLIAFAGTLAFDKAAERISGEKPIILPVITAHLIDMGPGVRYLRARCGEESWAICAYLPRLPMSWTQFEGGSPDSIFNLADNATKRRLAAEQATLALKVFAFDPVGVTLGFARDAIVQQGLFSLSDLYVPESAMADYRRSFPPAVSDSISRSRVYGSPAFLTVLSVVIYVTTILALLALAALVLARRRLGAADPFAKPGFPTYCGVVVAGVVINGVVTGVVASPLDRYQARVVWLIPMLALVALALASRPARGRGVSASSEAADRSI
jgi:hypothetical protein